MTKQEFSKIKSIEAKDGMILIKTNESDYKVKDTVLTVHEAAARAKALNSMAHKFDARDRKMMDEMITEIIDRCREAQQQIVKANNIPDGIKRQAIAARPGEPARLAEPQIKVGWVPDLDSPEVSFPPPGFNSLKATDPLGHGPEPARP
jgi:hypothetical protein